MWNGAGSVSPAGKACDWASVCHCDSCVAKRGDVVPRDTNELTQERAREISDAIESFTAKQHLAATLDRLIDDAERLVVELRIKRASL